LAPAIAVERAVVATLALLVTVVTGSRKHCRFAGRPYMTDAGRSTGVAEMARFEFERT
jgi:hypothetical protein